MLTFSSGTVNVYEISKKAMSLNIAEMKEKSEATAKRCFIQFGRVPRSTAPNSDSKIKTHIHQGYL